MPCPRRARELALLAACREGDRVALTRLIATHRAPIERFCRRLASPETYEDVLQESYVTILRGIATFRGESSFLTWAYTVCRSTAARWYQRQRRHPSAGHACEDELAAPGAQAGATRCEVDQVIERALVPLSPLDRRILVMRDGEGMSAAEVATHTGLTVGAVKTRLHRARVAARAQLNDLAA